jgi:SlyX protein
MSNDLEKRVIELESIISYQDQMLGDLNEIVINQQNQLDTLEAKVTKVKDSISNVQDTMNDKPPPHY